MTSVICRTFVQNTWRSDLCSNCFKSLEDHQQEGGRREKPLCSLPRYVPQAATLYQSRGISTSLKWRLNESLYVSRRDIASQTYVGKNNNNNNRGILVKAPDRKLGSRPSVDFASGEAVVIGYGGHDYDSDSPWEMGSDDDGSVDLDLLDDTDEDRNITRLTRNNTEFNSNHLKNHHHHLDAATTTINNNRNPVKSADKALSQLTYNDLQQSSVKTTDKKKLYFFPSGTDIKSYLNGRGSSLIVEVAKNETPPAHHAKVQNCERRKKLMDEGGDFAPLNTRAYSLVSELSKGGDAQSDSDYYSACRHVDSSTDSESLEELSRPPVVKSSPSFLHGTYAQPTNGSDLDKKSYDAGSSTSGDVSNFSDDSDTTYEPASDAKITPGQEERPAVLVQLQRETPKSQQQQQSSKNSPKSKQSFSPSIRLDNESYTLSSNSDRKSVGKRSQCDEELGTATKIGPEHTKKSSPSTTKSNNNSGHSSSPNCDRSRSRCDEDIPGKALGKDVETTSEASPKSTKHVNGRSSSPNTDRDTSGRGQGDESGRTPLYAGESAKKDVEATSQTGPELSRQSLPSTNFNNGHSQSPPSDPDKTSNIKRSENGEGVSRGGVESSPGQNVRSVETTPETTSKRSMPGYSAGTKMGPVSGTRTDVTGTEPTTPKASCGSSSVRQLLEVDQEASPLVPKVSEQDARDKDLDLDCDRSPDAIVHRQSKLAALALELELARRDAEEATKKSPPPETARIRSSENNNNYPTIKKASSAISCASRLPSLPDVLPDNPPQQQKHPKTKSKFSLKKLLKRNKESGTFSPVANSGANPKAWKKQSFDRNRLSLEIVHPMDLANDVPSSADSTPTEERMTVSTHPGKFALRGAASRARSLSALPQLTGDDGTSGIALLECRRTDTVPARKAGTVAERKKNRPSLLVRTPSCSALPNRGSGGTPQHAASGGERAPPPKPPPPPKCKAMHPPPPPPPPVSHPRCTTSPARPPPPKVPDPKSRSSPSVGSSAQELHEQNHSDKEYANLGDIRSLLTPKKPQRPSAFPTNGRSREDNNNTIYETLPHDEEDHYTYLDEAEAKASGSGATDKSCVRPWLDLHTSYAAIAAASYESLAELTGAYLNESVDPFRRVEQSLKWRDFVLESDGVEIGERTLYNATYKGEAQDRVTLLVCPRRQHPPTTTSPQQGGHHHHPTLRPPVLASFPSSSESSSPARCYVLRRCRLDTLGCFSSSSSRDCPGSQALHLRDYCFVLLQLIHALKGLQAEGVEEIREDLIPVLLLATTHDDEKEEEANQRPPVLVLFPEDRAMLREGGRGTLCQATLATLLRFLQVSSADELATCVVNGERLATAVAHTFSRVAKVLAEEKASSLSQAKAFLEYMLWGPVDVGEQKGDKSEEDCNILQRWLDLQRAQMVRSTLQGHSSRPLHPYEEYQLVFLLQASVKSLKNVVAKL